MSQTRTIIIDGQEVSCDPAMTLIQACEMAGIEVPRFCYHERLSIAGNCRMCLVEVVGGPPKPAASCAMQVRDLRPMADGSAPQIRTQSEMVKRAREGVMEFLLVNHPLDCPICDQGGECDLQDQAVAYGADFGRYREVKRASEDLDLGPLIETHMTRCISCTRCVRFTTEVAGIAQMGQTGRGEDAEITTYLGQTLGSNLQGNIIDLCPVGALVSKPYAFTARPWELRRTETVDVMDALGANICVDVKGRQVMRVLPRNHDGVNEEWISDKTRFVWDGLRRQRLDQPYIRENGKLRTASWKEALGAAAQALKDAKQSLGIVGDLVSVDAAYALKGLMESLGGGVECRTDGSALPADLRAAYAGTARIEELDTVQSVLLIGCNPVLESPVLNARLRKAWLAGAEIGLIGEKCDLSYPYTYLGADRAALEAELSKELSSIEEKPSVVILGAGAVTDKDGLAVLRCAMMIAKKTRSKFMLLQNSAGRVGALDIGAVTKMGIAKATASADVIYNLGCDEIELPDDAFVIYQGSHGDRGAHRADIILPGAAYTEETGIFVNTEGRVQMALRATFPPGEAKENWAVLRALSAETGTVLPFDTQDALRQNLFAAYPHLGAVDTVPENAWSLPKTRAKLGEGPFCNPVRDFYLTNPVARASTVMAELSACATKTKTASVETQ